MQIVQSIGCNNIIDVRTTSNKLITILFTGCSTTLFTSVLNNAVSFCRLATSHHSLYVKSCEIAYSSRWLVDEATCMKLLSTFSDRGNKNSATISITYCISALVFIEGSSGRKFLNSATSFSKDSTWSWSLLRNAGRLSRMWLVSC